MRILSIFGTRPEAIKMVPLVKRLEADGDVQSVVCVTGQHQTMLQQVLDLFGVVPNHNLAAMTANQTLNGLASRLFAGIDGVLETERPDRVLVHGDTLTSMAAALAAFHRRIPVGHVEAGLRTGNLYEPWPEEMNRRVVDVVGDLLFAPTASSQANLEAEALGGRVIVTGNTVIDALHLMCARLDGDAPMRARIDAQFPYLEPPDRGRPLLLVTGHRRESFGEGFANICAALAALAQTGKMQIVYPVHLNPNVRGPVLGTLGHLNDVHLTDPLDYPEFVRLMQRASIVLTDSGGVQEEAPALGKPVLVMRDVTERPEALAAGTVRLVGTDRNAIQQSVLQLVDDEAERRAFARRVNPYGDGHASERIVAALTGKPFEPFASRVLPGYRHPGRTAPPVED
ncbi:non-hydrolyzing UDP-N-acetylglucosamine 2-epimerase [Paraburkholderia caballeronis]|uniref:non-hydrolyzing UDP-N-acetylglucosamine 2-epimerase n=1 Tax=Paraburkholderia caballeronis TaxID=416943 RepID=UPI0010659575|nr:UDP-N-acetylglucosamine 2-epimerase (non-hydrolyzing) [Paraburkholderia caballeronis]TDV09524.1 UDP-N-acetylglucosamine 2-epimerase [Paraburkholderia caballeronis]TDV13795.1 UDP-N-acetylglucosamine 2-epimerase [Paraburkholderia caballeronis]TDV22977.1 UDP-N-acetylglucosamine 2-epimerase [Paraburkholderia caballeronis]